MQWKVLYINKEKQECKAQLRITIVSAKYVRKYCFTLWKIFNFSFRIQVEAKVSSKEDLLKVKQTETRILLLYSTKTEAENIMRWANEFELTTKNYIWIATQSVIGKERRASQEFPPGMLGTKTITIDK